MREKLRVEKWAHEKAEQRAASKESQRAGC